MKDESVEVEILSRSLVQDLNFTYFAKDKSLGDNELLPIISELVNSASGKIITRGLHRFEFRIVKIE